MNENPQQEHQVYSEDSFDNNDDVVDDLPEVQVQVKRARGSVSAEVYGQFN